MTFNSINFLLFFPVVVLIYFLIPQRAKNIWLLVCSYYFYMSWNPRYVLLIAFSTVITWFGGRMIGRWKEGSPNSRGKQKLCIALCIASNLLILGFFKYYPFLTNNLVRLLGGVGIGIRVPVFDVLLPVGISFYTFQALGYIIDVYRGTVKPEKNLLQYALFISFFPQLVAGPIERSKNLIRQIHEPHYFDEERVTRGLLLMGWGFFKKLVIADRAALLVTAVYNDYTSFTGLQIAAATAFFAVQIYCDFSGYSDIAIGGAQVLGFTLMENFHSPYFAGSVSEFWRRWHISLSTWFRDYVYIPLGGSRAGKWKKYRNLMITFCASGLWHGASWNYVAWGALNGFYQVIGDFTKDFRDKVKRLLHMNTQCWSYRFFQGVITFVLVDFAWLFFRANGLSAALGMLRHMLSTPGLFSMLNTDNVLGLATLSLDEKDFYVLLISIALLAAVDFMRDRICLRTALLRQNLVFRYAVYYCILFSILIFGIYGPEFDASTFIYFQF